MNRLFMGPELGRALPSILRGAKKSISLAMYQLAPPNVRQHAAVRAMWDELECAPSRGVDCYALLSKGGQVLPSAEAAHRAAERLVAAGWRVGMMAESPIMHIKCLVIDDAGVLCGSHNYTQSGLLCNREITTWLEGDLHAALAHDYIRAELGPRAASTYKR